jgi:glycosyltransferase involved in cell wall biosynthesis
MSDFFSKITHRKSATEHSPPQVQPFAATGAAGSEAKPTIQVIAPAGRIAEVLRLGRIAALAKTGLFDEAYYKSAYPDVVPAGANALEHFFDHGWREGKRPNSYFDPLWYAGQNPDVEQDQLNPLFHFAFHGDTEGRRAAPLFDSAWYRKTYNIPADQITLAHYLANRTTGRFSPLPEFDIAYYLTHSPDVAAAGIDAFEHFWSWGYREGRNPSAEFDVRFYAQRYLRGDLTENPFGHWLRHRDQAGIFGRMPENEASAFREVKRFTRPALGFEEFRPLPPTAKPRAKLLAYYLPQFHAFPENDTWWGKGFTEWTNVPRGLPRFRGHYQPRVPRDLGFYTLDTTEPMRRQMAMARAGGVHGFVFYYYWFNGSRLLERPLEAFLADRSINMPFALMWANENWTRRWDGAESEVLISQDYRAEDDERMIAEFARHFRDPRYIRLAGGRPLLMVYRPGIIPDAAATVARWRQVFRGRFDEDPVLVMAQAFGDTDPRRHGFDGATEFPPHKLTQHMQPINAQLDVLDADFTGKVYSYDAVVRESLDEPEPDFPLIKTVVPSWDNDARRQGTGLAITDSSPAKYEAWLAELVRRAEAAPFFGEKLVCVNAWNEWCEGAYLEPDLHWGAAYLNATGRALTGLSIAAGQDGIARVVLVGHDAFPSGAQQLLLEIGRTLRRETGIELEFVLLDGGRLEPAYREVAPTHVASGAAALAARVQDLGSRGFTAAIVNTTAAGHAVPLLTAAGIPAVQLVHELPRTIREKSLADPARAGIGGARCVVYPAAFVRDAVQRELGLVADERAVVQPQGLYKQMASNAAASAAIRSALKLRDGDRLVLGIGYADIRKGFDLFLQLWRMLRWRDGEGTHFCWLGDMDPGMRNWLEQELQAARATGTFHLPGRRDDVGAFLGAADALVLPSREDPFPSVVLEALAAGLPSIAFEGAGGIPDLLGSTPGLGTAVPYGDVPAMAEALCAAMAADDTAARAARRAVVAERFDFAAYARNLLSLALPALPQITAVVPNYNYARYMPERLGSIFHQLHPVREVVVLDDCSTDDSLEVIPRVAREAGRSVRLVPNTTNSGSVFAQWRKAAELAQGEYVWIAEADDLSDPRFLSRAMALMQGDPAVRLCFTDSRTVHADGSAMWESYKGYYETVKPGALSRTEVFEAADFVRDFLSVKNLILNVSAVVWRRDALLAALDGCAEELRGYRMAGDWRLYLEALRAPGARIGYEAEPLNTHRRHAESVTHALAADRHVEEIARCHALAAAAFPALAEAVKPKQAKYLEEVARQLGAGVVATASEDANADDGESKPGPAGKPARGKPSGKGPQRRRPR